MSLNEWAKLYEELTKPLPAVSASFLILFSSIVLFAPKRFSDALGLALLTGTYRWIPGVLLLVGTCWLIIIVVVPLGRFLHQRWIHTQQDKRIRKRLNNLTTDESHLLGMYMSQKVRSINWSGNDIGTAQALVEDGILSRPDVPPPYLHTISFNIVQRAVELLLEKGQSDKK